MKPDPIARDEELARLKEDLCRGSKAPKSHLAHLFGSDPATTAACALVTGLIVGLHPSLGYKVLGLGAWLIKRAYHLTLLALK